MTQHDRAAKMRAHVRGADLEVERREGPDERARTLAGVAWCGLDRDLRVHLAVDTQQAEATAADGSVDGARDRIDLELRIAIDEREVAEPHREQRDRGLARVLDRHLRELGHAGET